MIEDTDDPPEWNERLAVVMLPEHIDSSNAATIRGELMSVLNRGATAVIADMTRTLSCDSSGIGALGRICRRAVSSGTELQLIVTSPVIRAALSLSGTDQLVSIYPSREAALAARAPVALPGLVPLEAAAPQLGGAAGPDSGPGRIAADTDNVVQRLSAAGLSLDSALGMLKDHPAASRVRDAIRLVEVTIKDISDAVFDHRTPGARSRPPAPE